MLENGTEQYVYFIGQSGEPYFTCIHPSVPFST